MGDNFLFGIFPYIAFALAIAGGIYRYYSDRFSYSSLSSQFLENRVLFWGSVPWHYGIVLILLAHLFGGLFSGLSLDLLRVPTRLFILELIGASLGLIALVGIVLLIIRRIVDSSIRAVTSVMDWILIILLAAQVAAGLTIAVFYLASGKADVARPGVIFIGRPLNEQQPKAGRGIIDDEGHRGMGNPLDRDMFRRMYRKGLFNSGDGHHGWYSTASPRFFQRQNVTAGCHRNRGKPFDNKPSFR